MSVLACYSMLFAPREIRHARNIDRQQHARSFFLRTRSRIRLARALLDMLVVLLYTTTAFSPTARSALNLCQLPSRTCRQRTCGASASGSGSSAGERLGEYWDSATAFVSAFKVPNLAEDDLPEATALSAQIELVAVKFSGIKKVRRPEDFKTTPSNEDFSLLRALTGAYIGACIRRILGTNEKVNREPEAFTGMERAGEDLPPPPPPRAGQT